MLLLPSIFCQKVICVKYYLPLLYPNKLIFLYGLLWNYVLWKINCKIRCQYFSNNTMIVQNGDTLILGGILFETDQIDTNKIPLLGDIPIVGMAFRHDEVSKSTNELMIFLTPHVIDKAPEKLDDLIEETRKVINDPKVKFDNMVEELQKSIDEIQ